MDTEDIFFQKRIQDLADQSWRNNVYTFTGFLTMAQQDLYLQMLPRLGSVESSLYGGTDGCERQVLRFGGEQSLGYEEPFPICCIRVRPALAKFADALTHRDYLGALMHLGIERSTIGDIVLREQEAYLFCLEQVADYILEELTRIRHTTVRCQKMDQVPETVRPSLEPCRLIVSSMRLDTVIAKLYHLSRSQSLDLFREQKVFVGGRQTTQNSGLLRPGDVVSVRGYGKFVCGQSSGQTKKGNLYVEISRYV